MKFKPHANYLHFIFFFLLILWGAIGIFDSLNIYFDLYKPLAANQPDTRMNSLNLLGNELPEKSKEEIRILTLGDSVTYGLGVSVNEDWPSQMADYLRKNGVAAISMNAGKPGHSHEQMYQAYHEILKKGITPDIVIVYAASGNFLNYSIERNDVSSFFKKVIPNYPNKLFSKEEVLNEKLSKIDKTLALPSLIKLHGYVSPFFGILVRNIFKLDEKKNEFFQKNANSLVDENTQDELKYLAKILSLAKVSNTSILIVKPFYIFKSKNFTEEAWNFFAKQQIAKDFSEMPKIQGKVSDRDLMYEYFKDYAYILDPAEKILSHIHVGSEFEDQKKLMYSDFVHFNKNGLAILGKIIGDYLIAQKLVKKISKTEWIHPNVLPKGEASRMKKYLQYRSIPLNYLNKKSYFVYLSFCFLALILFRSSKAYLSIILFTGTIGLFSYIVNKFYLEDLIVSVTVFIILISVYTLYTISRSISFWKTSFYIFLFGVLVSSLVFLNVNLLMKKFSSIADLPYHAILKENIAWSEYLQFFIRKMIDHTFELNDVREEMHTFRLPIPFLLIINIGSNYMPLLFAPVIPAFFSSVFKFDSVEIFFLLASLPYIVLYLMYIKIINKIIISKMKYLLYPIGLFFIKQEIDFLLPIVFLILSLTSLGIYSIYSPVKKYPVTRYLSALAFWPLYYLVIPETLVLLGLVCVYFFLIELYRNSFRLWTSMQNTFLWICVLFIPKLFILILPSSKVNLDSMIQYNLLPKTFHLHSVYSFLATLLLLLFLHANIEKIKACKRKILQVGRNAF